MRRRAKAQIVAAVPVNEVVSALIAGFCKVGNLVLFVAVVFQLFHCIKVKIGGFIAGGQAFGWMLSKGRIRLDLQQICRNMGSPTTLDQFQRFVKLGFGVVGQCQHDVAADVRKPCAPGGGKSSPRLLCRVRSAQCAQLGIPGRLHPKRDAVHARLPEACKAFFRHRLRVCFQCDLGPRHRPGRIDQPFCLLRAQQAGRAAAKIKGVRLQRCFRRKAGKLPQKSIHIGIRHAALTGMGIEIAVSAFGKTVRNV